METVGTVTGLAEVEVSQRTAEDQLVLLLADTCVQGGEDLLCHRPVQTPGDTPQLRIVRAAATGFEPEPGPGMDDYTTGLRRGPPARTDQRLPAGPHEFRGLLLVAGVRASLAYRLGVTQRWTVRWDTPGTAATCRVEPRSHRSNAFS